MNAYDVADILRAVALVLRSPSLTPGRHHDATLTQCVANFGF